MESGSDAALTAFAGAFFDSSDGGAGTTGELTKIEEDVA